jgi:TRAP-type mannitol/chloroaromatic compound transport system permease small subunit
MERLNMSNQGVDRIMKVIDQISLWSGKAAAWLIIPMAAVLVFEIFIRKFYFPTIWANDVATMSYGAHFMLPGAYTLYLHKHIRTDFFYEKFSPRLQALVDGVLYLFLFLPGMVIFLLASWTFASESWVLKEQILTTWRPPAYPLKMVIPVSVGLLVIQGISELMKCIRAISQGRKK